MRCACWHIVNNYFMHLAITPADVHAAAERIAGHAVRTPTITNPEFNARVGREVFFKCENLQRTGSFKFRGAYNAINQMTPDQLKRGVVAFSSGNHAQAVALAARLHGAPAVIVMPDDAPETKVRGTLGYGAEVVRYDRLKEDREAIARNLSETRGLSVVPPFDHPHVMAGQGTLALEWLADVPNLDAIVIQVGGGGLIAGCAVAAKSVNPNIRVFGVEPQDANDTKLSLLSGTRIKIAPPITLADGIRTPQPGALTFPIVQALVEDVIVIDEASILPALRVMVQQIKLVAEPTGAVALAALLSGLLPDACKRVGILVCGGNVEPALLAS